MKKVVVLLVFSIALGVHSTGLHSCQPPPVPKNGGIRGALQTSYDIGGYVEFLCHSGFKLQGESLTVCIDTQDGGVWNKPTPICVPITCSYPPTLTNGLVLVREGLRVGATLQYSCDPGYVLVGSAVRSCREDGRWSPAPPTCQLLRCPSLKSTSSGSIHLSNGNNPGSMATYSCVRGYSLVGNEKRTCGQDGVWSGSDATCQLVDCGPPPSPKDGSVSTPDGTTFNRDAWFSCNDGFELVGPESTRCLADRRWSPEPPTCRPKPVNCGTLVAPSRGLVEVTGTTLDSTATYSCTQGYTLLGGSQVRTCQANGHWSGSVGSCRAINCGLLANPTNGRVLLRATIVGSFATYQCSSGFTLTGESLRQCLEVNGLGVWSGSPPTCTVIDCGSLPSIENGAVEFPNGNTNMGASAVYSCISGYMLSGDQQRVCQSTATWSGTQPQCIVVDCGVLPAPRNGQVEMSGTSVADKASYSCNSGFMLMGSRMRSCLDNGQWSETAPTCETTFCPYLSDPTSGLVRITSTAVGAQATYECFRGFSLDGNAVRVCSGNGQWTGVEPRCTLVDCGNLRDPDNGQVSLSGTDFGSRARYRCFSGYTLQGETSRLCEDDGFWTGEAPICVFIGCPYLDPPANGKVELSGMIVDSIATFTCDPGFELIGKTLTRVCQSDGRWSGISPQCRPVRPPLVTCPALTSPANGQVFFTTVTVGSVARYTCTQSFQLVGIATRVCRDDGVWSGTEPFCRPITVPRDVEFTFSQASYNIQEGAGFVTVTVDLLTGSPSRQTVLTISTDDLTATDTVDTFGCFDYESTSVTVSFPAGSIPGSQRTVSIPINDDNCVERPETFRVTATSTDTDVTFPRGSSSTVSIQDNDTPLYRFTEPSYAIDEDESPVQPAIELFSNTVLTFPATVRVVDLPGGSATDGIDYTGVSANVVFPTGSRQGTEESFNIPITDDQLVEGDETILLQASTSAPGDVPTQAPGQDRATVVIRDDDLCIVGLEFDTYEIQEGNVEQEICVVKRNAAELTRNAVVTVSTSDIPGEATAGLDYTSLPSGTVVTFGPGRPSRACVRVPILADSNDEPNERFRVNIEEEDDQLSIQPGDDTATVTITDDDVLDLAFTQRTYDVNEGDRTVEVCVELIAGIPQERIRIDLSAQDGSARGGSDFTSVSPSVSFPAGTSPGGLGSEQCAEFPITDDNLVERPEDFRVVARSDDPMVMFPRGRSSTVNIQDNDIPLFRFTEPSYTVNEDESPVQPAIELFSNTVLTFPVTVRVVDIPDQGSATDGVDYIGVSVDLLFRTGSSEGTQMSFEIPIIDDITDEPDETIILQASTSAPGEVPSQAPGQDRATVIITDNDSTEVEFAFTQRTYNVNEGDRVVRVTVELITGTLDRPIPLTVSNADITATDTVDTFGCFDYESTSVTVSFPAGSVPGSQRTVSIPINDDNCVERPETFRVTATSTDTDVTFPRGSSSTVSIQDNDTPLYRFTEPSYTVDEDDSPVQPAIELFSNTVLTFPATVRVVDLPGGSATDGIDYTGVSANVVFPTGSHQGSEESFNIPITDDQLVEGDETILLQASTSAPGEVPTQAPGQDRATVVIRDDDLCIVGLEFDTYEIQEGNVEQEICIVKRNAAELTRNAVVTVSTSGIPGEATAGLDYTSLPSGTVVTFGPGRPSRACVRVPILEDSNDEPNERFRVSIEEEDDQISIQPGDDTATVTITDDDVLDLAFTQRTYDVNEGDRIVEVCVELIAGIPQERIRIDLSAQDGSARGGSDFTSVSPSVSFPAGTSPGGLGSEQCAEFPITDDNLVERPEDFRVVARSDDPMVMFPRGRSSTVNIQDNDIPLFRFTEPSYTVNEGDSPVQPAIELFSNTVLTFPVTVRVVDIPDQGSATDGVDYIGVSVDLLFRTGSSQGTQMSFDIPIIDDITDEPDETIILQASTSAPGEVPSQAPGQDRATVVITDNDFTEVEFSFTQRTYNVNEGDRVVRVTVELITGTLDRPIPLTVSDADITATDTVDTFGCFDYESTSVTVSFPAGSIPGSQRTVSIPINDDNCVERPETFRVTATSTDTDVTFPRGSSSTVSIQDNDTPLYRFTEPSYTVNEGDSPVQPAIELFSNTVLTFPATVRVVDLRGGSATDGIDYTGVSANVVFPTGSRQGREESFSIPITDDQLVEGDETILLQASTSAPGEVPNQAPGQDRATVVIRDDDLCIVGLEFDTYEIQEGNVEQEICVVKRNAAELTRNAVVTVSTSGIPGEATAGLDYTSLPSGTVVTFGPGRPSRACVRVPILEDSNDEPNERFRVNIEEEDDQISIQPGDDTATVTITDDDVLDLAFTQRTYDVNEGDRIVEVCVELIAGIPQERIRIDLSAQDGSARGGSDFISVSPSVSFPAGTSPGGPGSEQCAEFPITDDNLVERPENFRVVARSDDPMVMFSRGRSSTVNIQDNDIPIFQFTERSYSVDESDGPARPAIELVDKILTFPINIAIVDVFGGSATDGVDYIGVETTVVFPANSRPGMEQSFTIPIIDDDLVEDRESINLEATASAPGQFVPRRDVAIVFIIDDDVNDPEFAFTQRTYNVNEGDRVVRVTVELTLGSVTQPTPVTISTSDRSATDTVDTFGCFDYESTSVTVSFPAGSVPGSQRTVSIPINDDNCVERPETFRVTATSTDTDVTFPRGSSSTVSIQDNDTPLYRFTEPSYIVNEGDSPAQPAIELFSNTVLTFPATVRVVDLPGGSATDGIDYTGVSANVVFPTGSRQGREISFNIQITNDLLAEGDETILLQASTSAPGDVPTQAPGQDRATVVIRDDDFCEELSNPANGRVRITGLTAGSTATYTCSTGFILEGSQTRNCQGNGQWSSQAPFCRIVDCGRLSDPRNGDVSFRTTTFNSRAAYSCNNGFLLVGQTTRVCQSTGEWSGIAPVCRSVDCGRLSDPTNGDVSFTSTTVNSRATYSCSNGFLLVGQTARVCQSTGEWSGKAPVCRIIDCGRLSDPTNGDVSFTSTTVNSRATYSCSNGFLLVGQTARVCQSTGEWSGKAPVCRIVDCGRLSDPTNGGVSFRTTTFNSRAAYSCNNGFLLVGQTTRVCQSTGEWSGKAPVCKIVDCGRLSDPTNGDVSFTSTTVNSRATYSCSNGFLLVGRTARVCQSTGEWSGKAPVCKIVDCGRLSDPTNGDVSFRTTTFNSRAAYSCNNGFLLVGQTTRVCQSNGEWSGKAPVCKIVGCDRLSDPTNGDVSFTSTTVNSKATYSCNNGFILVGQTTRICQSTGEWSGKAPVCKIVDCGRLFDPRNGDVSFKTTTFNSRAAYSCNNGFLLVGQTTRVCQRNGEWSGKAPVCKNQCPNLRHPENGLVRFGSQGRSVGAEVWYSCNSGYILTGTESRECQRDLTWSGESPICKAAPHSCSQLSSPANGKVWFSSTSIGSIAKYTCSSGYTLSGSVYRKCLSTSEWHGSAPICKRSFVARGCPKPSAPNNGFAFVQCLNVGCRINYWCNSGYSVSGSRKVICQSNGQWSSSTPTCRRYYSH
ncbi:uncharacterized protein LOC135341566 isoform X3 [Halichondria panicea]|uniref:uncharacterized protein LOC135341566 isoform X3 n=1 Tax=Halichondria panicea TaxID=6063 RepID=UPI00312BA137